MPFAGARPCSRRAPDPWTAGVCPFPPAAFAFAPAGTPQVVLTADVGATTPDKVSQHWAEGHAYQTVAGMAAWAEARAADLAFIVGDLSYATVRQKECAKCPPEVEAMAQCVDVRCVSSASIV